jgi:putative phage-type endonuclease
MPDTQQRLDWLAERRLGIGGSDAASLFNVGWGCRRRLWYDKTNKPQDYPREETKPMALGRVLEPFFAEEYETQTGRTVVNHDQPFVHPEIPELRVNVDRSVYIGKDEDAPMGVLEIKSCGRAAFYKYKTGGLPEDYILQLQHGMLVTGATWGSFAIGSRDSGELIYWDVEADAKLQAAILEEGPKFWRLVENGPMPDALEPDDSRCQKCEYRRTCQGNALMPTATTEMPQFEILRPLLDEYDEKRTAFAEAEEAFDGVREEIKSELGHNQAVMVGERKVYYKSQEGRVTWQGKELAIEMAKFIGGVIVELTNGTLTLERFVKDVPVMEKFKKQGSPFKTLRIY